MPNPPQSNVKFLVSIGALVIQAAGMLYYLGQQQAIVTGELSQLRHTLGKIESNQAILAAVVTDVAVLKVQQATGAAAIRALQDSRSPNGR